MHNTHAQFNTKALSPSSHKQGLSPSPQALEDGMLPGEREAKEQWQGTILVIHNVPSPTLILQFWPPQLIPCLSELNCQVLPPPHS